MLALIGLVAAGCGGATEAPCPSAERVDLRGVDPEDAALPFRYPMDVVENRPREADFCEYRGPGRSTSHAAEDYWRPAGTEVHAMADGVVSYSGTMGGYGWLVIVDHPEINIYSLYGHLSPSRWRVGGGERVSKGDLLGHLGDEWENGGSVDKPLVAHLHLGVRTGQRADYPGKGEWRWMAGWITPCPADLGWLQPSAVIAAQAVPDAGFDGPAGGLLERWWGDLVLVGLVLLGPVAVMANGVLRRKPYLVMAVAPAVALLGWFASSRHVTLISPFYVVAGVALLAGAAMLAQERWRGAS